MTPLTVTRFSKARSLRCCGVSGPHFLGITPTMASMHADQRTCAHAAEAQTQDTLWGAFPCKTNIHCGYLACSPARWMMRPITVKGDNGAETMAWSSLGSRTVSQDVMPWAPKMGPPSLLEAIQGILRSTTLKDLVRAKVHELYVLNIGTLILDVSTLPRMCGEHLQSELSFLALASESLMPTLLPKP